MKETLFKRCEDRASKLDVLHYSAVPNNLTPKLTESDTVEIISGLYPA